MKLTILESTNKIKLIQALRKHFPQMTLSEGVSHVKNLPTSFEDLSLWEINDLKKKIKAFASYKEEKEYYDLTSEEQMSCFNTNINPPSEYIAANSWYESLGEVEKNHIKELMSWWNRPAVC